MNQEDDEIYKAWMTLYNTNRPMLHQFLIKHPLIEKQLVFHFKQIGVILPMPDEDDRVNCDMALKLLRSIK